MSKIVGIIGAMEVEVELLIRDIKEVEEIKYSGITFYKGYIEDKKVIVSQCGIGKVNSAMCTQIMITKFLVDKIINTGVAGAIENSLNIYDVVIGKTMIQYDFDLTIFGRKLGHIPNMESEKIEGTKVLVEKAYESAKKVIGDNRVRKGTIVTGDKFINGKEEKEMLQKQLNGTCGEMESGAIAQVCILNKIDYVIIRAISDKANDTAFVDFDEFVGNASKDSYKIVRELLNTI